MIIYVFHEAKLNVVEHKNPQPHTNINKPPARPGAIHQVHDSISPHFPAPPLKDDKNEMEKLFLLLLFLLMIRPI